MAVAINLPEFLASVENFADLDVPHLVTTAQRKIAADGLAGVTFRTPVDTGRARGNWLVSLEYATTAVLDGEDKAGVSTLRKGVREISKSRLFGTIYISNNVAYIEALENGHSAQAPAGMLTVTFNDLLAKFKAGAE